MANIKTKEDWWKSAAETIPKLREYSDNFGYTRGKWDEEAAKKELEVKDHESLARRFNQLWAALPDSMSIHMHPFGDLCDLCSEYWVFQEEVEHGQS
jgi:hypothetical protein